MLSDAVNLDASSQWALAAAALAVPAGLACQIILQIMARAEAARVAKQAQDDALKAQEAAARAEREAARAGVKAEQVKVALATTNANTSEKLGEIAASQEGLQKVAATTHRLVNHAMTIELKANAELSRWKADQTRDAGDIKMAEAAEHKYAEHLRQQSQDDAADRRDAS